MRQGRTSLPHGPLLAGDELVRPTEEDLSGKVPPQFTAEGALDGDGLEREFLRPGGNSLVTVFAVDDELLAFLHHEPHGRIITTESSGAV